MINYLRHMAVFAKVVDEGSFRAAARELSLAPSWVSQTVSDLEEYLGVTLLYRTTRKLVITSEGRIFYSHVANMLRGAETGLNELNALSLEPVGELKISLPAFLTSSVISSAIAKFAYEYSGVSVSLIYSDHVVDILSEGLDLSIRAGWPKDSALMSRKVGESKRMLIAGKAYMDTKPVPKHPSELNDWDWIRFSMRPGTHEFVSASGEKVSISENSRISVNNVETLVHFASQNLGLSIVPEFFAEERLKSGEFVQVLPEWKLAPIGYYALWPDTSRRENLTLYLVRFLVEHCL